MDKAHYIIFHPDKARQAINAKATVIENGQVNTTWEGKICVDSIDNGNEDPFVFSDPWLYSYCHATQLRRNPRKNGSYLQPMSKIFFVSGDCANNNLLTIDTLFLSTNQYTVLSYRILDNTDNDTWTRFDKTNKTEKLNRRTEQIMQDIKGFISRNEIV